MTLKVCGPITRNLYSSWQHRAGNSTYLPADSVRQLFNDLHLYPSYSQVFEMLQCAQECSHRKSPAYLTFGEFCVFATELKKGYEKQLACPITPSKPRNKHGSGKECTQRNMSKSYCKYDVFLGGSCNPTTWRQDVAIPVLKNLGITFYNPQVSHWVPELIERENKAKETASVLFFVIDNQTRSVASMIEAAYIAGCQRKLILVINKYEGPGQLIYGEPMSQREYDDLTTAQLFLHDVVERQGIPVFEDLVVAIKCTEKLLKENISVQELTLEDAAQPVKMGYLQLGDKLIKLREAFDALDTNSSGQISLADVCIAFRILTNRDLSMEDLHDIMTGQKSFEVKNASDVSLEDVDVDFDQFCCIVSEFVQKHPETRHIWDTFLSKTSSFIQSFLSPVTKLLEWPNLPWLGLSGSNNGCNNSMRDIYLGGSCGETKWRDDLAIPLLKKSGLTYFNPQTAQWCQRFIPLEAAAIESCRVLLFVITNRTRSLAAMTMASHFIGLGFTMIICVQKLNEDNRIGNEKLSPTALKDYNRGRSYLSDMANREGVPVFDDILEAVECAISKCKMRR